MIDKRVPRVYNGDLDARLSKSNELVDAYNIQIGTDYDADNAPNAAGPMQTGDAGIIKPAVGNVATNDGPLNEGDITGLFDNNPNVTGRRVIGQVNDNRTGIVYFFVYSQDPLEQGVYAVNNGRQDRVHTSQQYRFPGNGFVDAEVVHVSDGAGGFRPILYFTDNENEPRSLDVLDVYNPATGAGTVENETTMFVLDRINACPKTPIHPITFDWANNPLRLVSEFRGTKGLQFAYQCIYRSGEVSAPSTYSQIAIPPAYLQQGSSTTIDVDYFNTLRLYVPQFAAANPGQYVENYTNHVEEIKLLVREGTAGAWLEITNIPAQSGFEIGAALPQGIPEQAQFGPYYDYTHSEVLSGFPAAEQFKQYDSMPRIAETLAVVENRLMFGNYVENYDEPELLAGIVASYRERPNDFVEIGVNITSRVLPVAPGAPTIDASTYLNDRLRPLTTAEGVFNKKAGFEVRLTDIPESIPAGTTLNFSMSFNPAEDIHLYDSTYSYHGGRVCGLGEFDPGAPAPNGEAAVQNTIFPNWLNVNNNGWSGIPYGGVNPGVFSEVNQAAWVTTDGPEAGTQVDVVVGCSAATPYVIKGEQITFSMVLNVAVDISENVSQVLLDAIGRALTGQQPTEDESINFIGTPNITPAYTYSYNLPEPVEDTESDLFGYRVLNTGGATGDNKEHNNLASKIVPVFSKSISDSLIDGSGSDDFNPCGYFFVQQAYVQYSLSRRPDVDSLALEDSAFFFLEIDDHQILEQFTCIPRFQHVLEPPTSWVLITPEQMQADALPNTPDFYGVTGFDGVYFLPEQNPGAIGIQNGLITSGTQIISDGKRQNLNRALGYLNLNINPLKSSSELSILDGEGGVRNRRNSNRLITPVPTTTVGAGVTVNWVDDTFVNALETFFGPTFLNMSTGLLNDKPYPSGVMVMGTTVTESSAVFGGAIAVNFLGQETGESFLLQYTKQQTKTFFPMFDLPQGGFFNGGGTVGFQPMFETSLTQAATISQFELPTYALFISENEAVGVYRSFKTSANHNFGIVYYDERGRPGDVNTIPSVYVGGYSNEERDAQLQGRVEIQINIASAPPAWAHKYQVVYAGNNTYSSFRQFITGGAFVASVEGSEERNIYVSLNYLQDSHLSYTQAFGAVNVDGSKQMYTYQPGDILRVISYFTNETERVYPVNYTFEVVDQVDLTKDYEFNPLANEDEQDTTVDLVRTGQFVVLRDNPLAANFSASAILSGSNGPDSNTHGWNERCLVEIVRPANITDEEERPYFEIGRAYHVGQAIDGTYYHEVPQIVLTEGDVYWRRVPQNIATYDEDTQSFPNLYVDEESQSRFRDYYLETETFTDKYPLADWKGYGKPHFVKNTQEVRRFASITYSDLNDYSTTRLSYSSFNHTTAPFRDFPNTAGNINRLLTYPSGLFCVQEDEASIIPVQRSLIQDAAGADTLVTSTKILGTQKVLPGGSGCDNNPESVLRVGNHVYWANKAMYEVYKFNPQNGIQVISQKGTASRFNTYFALVNQAADNLSRVPTGYDPLNDEFLITIGIEGFTPPIGAVYNQPFVNTSVEFFSDPDGVLPDVPDIFVPDGDGAPPDDGPFPDVPGFGEDIKDQSLYNDLIDILNVIEQEDIVKGERDKNKSGAEALANIILTSQFGIDGWADAFADISTGISQQPTEYTGGWVLPEANFPGITQAIADFTTGGINLVQQGGIFPFGITVSGNSAITGVYGLGQQFNIQAIYTTNTNTIGLGENPEYAGVHVTIDADANTMKVEIPDVTVAAWNTGDFAGGSSSNATINTALAVAESVGFNNDAAFFVATGADYSNILDTTTGLPLTVPEIMGNLPLDGPPFIITSAAASFVEYLGAMCAWFLDQQNIATVNVDLEIANFGKRVDEAVVDINERLSLLRAGTTNTVILAVADQLQIAIDQLDVLNTDVLSWNATGVMDPPNFIGSQVSVDPVIGLYSNLNGPSGLNDLGYTDIVNAFTPVLAAAAQIDGYIDILTTPSNQTAGARIQQDLQAVNDAVDTLIDQISIASDAPPQAALTAGVTDSVFSAGAYSLIPSLSTQFPTIRNRVVYAGQNFQIAAEDIVDINIITEPLNFLLEDLTTELTNTNEALVDPSTLSFAQLTELINAKLTATGVGGLVTDSYTPVQLATTIVRPTDINFDGATTTADLLNFLVYFGDPNDQDEINTLAAS